MKRTSSIALFVLVLAYTNLYSQTVIWKLEGGNVTTGVGQNAGRSVSVFGATSAIGSASTWWGPTQYLYVTASSWGGGSNTKGFKMIVKTVLYQNLTISYAHNSDDFNGTNVGPRDFQLQYSLDDITYVNVPNGTEVLVGGTSFDNCLTKTNLALPAACNNANAVYLRWLMTSNTGVQNKAITPAGASNLANIIVSGTEIQVAPTDIALSNASLASNQPIGTTVGTLSATDLNSSNTFTYSLTSGSGSTNNDQFTISGNQLKINAALAAGTYSVRINVNDGTYDYSKSFTITIVNQAPSDIALSNDWITPGAPSNTLIGTLTATDADNGAGSHTFSLVAGEGDTDNSSFTISGNELRTNGVLPERTYTVRINVNDGVNDLAEPFLISVGYKLFLTSYPDVFYVSNVTVNSINNSSSYGANGYGNYAGEMTSVTRGSTYPVSVTINPADVLEYGLETYLKIKLYADWNHNYSFDDDGEGFDITSSISTLSNSNDITVPSDATLGQTRIRIICWYDYVSADGSLMPPSYGLYDYGESEDYTLDVSAVLPVELTHFSAAVQDGKVRVAWRTASETNNHGYEIERSTEKNSFAKIGFVQGGGTTNAPRTYSFTDEHPMPGECRYRLKQLDRDGRFTYCDAVSVPVGAPKEFLLMQNSPNPFNPSTAITFEIPAQAMVSLKIYDQLGREVATLVDEVREPGSYTVHWNGRDHRGRMTSSGVYLYRWTAGSHVETRRMVMMK